MEPLGNPSYRRVTETRATYSRASASPSSGFRSQSWSRGSGSTVSSSYKRSNVGGPRAAYGSTVLSSGESLDVSQSSLLNGAAELKLSRSNEKEQLQGLNDRFAGYIEKVHYLEQQNKEIEAELAALRQKHAGRAQLSDAYEQELRELRGALEQVSHEKAQIQLDSEHIEEDIQRLRERFEDEARLRDETEATIRALRKEMEEASLMRAELDKKVQSLQDEVAFLRGNHEEEVAELLAQLQASHATVERKDYLKTDLTTALKEIDPRPAGVPVRPQHAPGRGVVQVPLRQADGGGRAEQGGHPLRQGGDRRVPPAAAVQEHRAGVGARHQGVAGAAAQRHRGTPQQRPHHLPGSGEATRAAPSPVRAGGGRGGVSGVRGRGWWWRRPGAGSAVRDASRGSRRDRQLGWAPRGPGGAGEGDGSRVGPALTLALPPGVAERVSKSPR